MVHYFNTDESLPSREQAIVYQVIENALLYNNKDRDTLVVYERYFDRYINQMYVVFQLSHEVCLYLHNYLYDETETNRFYNELLCNLFNIWDEGYSTD